MIDDRTSAAAPLVHPFGHDVEESGCVIHPGQDIGFLLGSVHLGLCNEDFPDHRAKLHDNNNANNATFRQWGVSFGPLEQDSHRAPKHPRPFSFTQGNPLCGCDQIVSTNIHASHSTGLRTCWKVKNDTHIVRNQLKSSSLNSSEPPAKPAIGPLESESNQ